MYGGAMLKAMKGLGFKPGSRIKELISLSAAIQRLRFSHPDLDKRSATPALTRSTVLFATGELDPRIRRILEESRLKWASFQEMLGIEKIPPPIAIEDADLGTQLRRALKEFAANHRDCKIMDLPEITLAIVEAVIANPKSKGLPIRLSELGLDFENARIEITKFANVKPPPEFTSGTKDEPESVGKDEKPKKPSKTKPQPLRHEEHTPTHLDDPTRVDQLNRRPFADVMAIRIREIWDLDRQAGSLPTEARVKTEPMSSTGSNRKKGELSSAPSNDHRSLAVHIHGPWGAGKTSVLNFLRKNLEAGTYGQPWVVVDFNAWRHQRTRPPWWTLIHQVYQQTKSRLQDEKPGIAKKLRRRWFIWRLRADWLPVVMAALVILFLMLFVSGMLFGWGGTEAVSQGATNGAGKHIETGLKLLTALLAAGAGAIALGRSLLFGSAKAAQSYLEFSQDPMGPIAQLFQKLINAVEHPVAIFIDDLDRCDSDYVVELLEGIQTLFRRADVTYVVAADRDWIRASYEKRYGDFTNLITQPARPLGYLFLEKIFQVSATLPLLSPSLRDNYWKALLKATETDKSTNTETVARDAEREAEKLISVNMTPIEMEKVIKDHGKDPIKQHGLRAVAAKRISSSQSEKSRAHFLQPFAGLLEPNPRAMKRLINAYGIQQAVNFLEGRRVDPRVLALWTIIEMRWPLLANLLTKHPTLISKVGQKTKPTDERIPDDLKDLFISPEIERVVQGNGISPPVALDAELIQQAVGLSVLEEPSEI
jgi:hypothetical protein